MSKQRARKVICWTVGHDWEHYNFTKPVMINMGQTTTYAEFGRRCKRCGFDEYKGVQDFINYVELTKKKSEGASRE